jgi:tetratricopeptide (TPR) repeat protein
MRAIRAALPLTAAFFSAAARAAAPDAPPPIPTAAARPSAAAYAIREADEHYAARGRGGVDGRASATEISMAIAGYGKAAAEDPDSAEARWKLARALYFLGSYTNLDDSGRRAAFDRARRIGDEAIAVLRRRRANRFGAGVGGAAAASGTSDLDPAQLASLLRGDPDAPPSLFWAAVGWGQWGLGTNKLEAARQGVARRIRDECLALIALAPAFEEGGGYRILGRLHARAPRIPLVTGWVSRAEGIRLLRLAVATAPDNLVNLQFLAEALAEAGERAEAIALEERIIASRPDPSHAVEELAIQRTARTNLEAWKKRSQATREPAPREADAARRVSPAAPASAASPSSR